MISVDELEQIGRKAAELAAGENAVSQVEVLTGEDDLDRPAYFFSFLIDEKKTLQRPGLVRTRLQQNLRDELVSRGDGRYPVIRILSAIDWEKRLIG